MDIQQLISLGTTLLNNSSFLKDKNISIDTLKESVQTLFSDGFDISKLLSIFGDNKDIGAMVSNFFGNGNTNISPDKIVEIFGNDKVKSFAEKLNLNEDEAKNAIAEVIPNLVNKVKEESGNELLDQAKDMLGKFL